MAQVHAWKYFEAITRPALSLAPRDYLANIRAGAVANDIPGAVADHDTPWLFERLFGAAQMQGISDRNAGAFVEKHGIVGWDEVALALKQSQPVRAFGATGASRAAGIGSANRPARSRSISARAAFRPIRRAKAR